MRIELTKEEYRTLMEMLYLASWMLDAHKTGGPSKDSPHYILEQKMYGLAAAAGLAGLVERSSDGKEYFPPRDFEDDEALRDAIDEYDDATFWGELVERLAERELLRTYGIEKVRAMSRDEYIYAYGEAEDKYAQEFADHGIERLVLAVSSPSLRGGTGGQRRKRSRQR